MQAQGSFILDIGVTLTNLAKSKAEQNLFGSLSIDSLFYLEEDVFQQLSTKLYILSPLLCLSLTALILHEENGSQDGVTLQCVACRLWCEKAMCSNLPSDSK